MINVYGKGNTVSSSEYWDGRTTYNAINQYLKDKDDSVAVRSMLIDNLDIFSLIEAINKYEFQTKGVLEESFNNEFFLSSTDFTEVTIDSVTKYYVRCTPGIGFNNGFAYINKPAIELAVVELKDMLEMDSDEETIDIKFSYDNLTYKCKIEKIVDNHIKVYEFTNGSSWSDDSELGYYTAASMLEAIANNEDLAPFVASSIGDVLTKLDLELTAEITTAGTYYWVMTNAGLIELKSSVLATDLQLNSITIADSAGDLIYSTHDNTHDVFSYSETIGGDLVVGGTIYAPEISGTGTDGVLDIVASNVNVSNDLTVVGTVYSDNITAIEGDLEIVTGVAEDAAEDAAEALAAANAYWPSDTELIGNYSLDSGDSAKDSSNYSNDGTYSNLDPLAEYHLDGDATDSSENEDDATEVGTYTYETGVVGSAFQATYNTGYLDFSTSLVDSRTELSFSGWIYINTLASAQSILTTSDSSVTFTVQADNTLMARLYFSDATDTGAISGGTVVSGWNHCMFRFSSTTGYLSIGLNNVEVINQTGFTGKTLATSTYLRTYPGTSGITCKYDDFRFYEYFLTNAEVNALYSRPQEPSYYIDGISGKALAFNEKSTYNEVAISKSVAGFSEISLSTWVYFNATTSSVEVRPIYINDDVVRMYKDSTNHLCWYVYTENTVQDIQSDIVINTGQWYHFAATYDGTDAKMYINGTIAGTASLTGNLRNNGSNIYFGNNTYGAGSYEGAFALDEIRIYERALTEGEIVGLYKFISKASSAAAETAIEVANEAITLADTAIDRIASLNTRGLSLKMNYSDYSTVNPGEIYMHGFDADGDAADVDGFIMVNGYPYTVPKSAIDPSYLITAGYIMYSTDLSDWYIVEVDSSGTWYRYQDSTQTAFTPDDTCLFVGYVEMDAIENFTYATLWSSVLDYQQVVNLGIVNNVAAETTAATQAIANISDDSILSAVEKPQLIQAVALINSEDDGIITEATRFAVSSTTYSDAITALNNYLAAIATDNEVAWNDTSGYTNIANRTTFTGYFTAVYEARQALLNAIYAAAKSLIDGKIVVYYQDAEPTGASEGDLWFDTDDGNKIYVYNTGAWVEAQDSAIAELLTDLQTLETTVDGKAVIYFQDDAPSSEVSNSGDMWIETDNNNKTYVYSGTAWVPISTTDAIQALSSTATALDVATATWPADTNILGYYPLNEDVDDYSANANDGVISGAPTYVEGMGTNAISFDGSDDDVQITNPTYTNTGYTIAMWLYMIDSTNMLWSHGVFETDGLYHQSGDLIFSSSGGSSATQAIPNTLNTWMHLAITADTTSQSANIYIDGELYATKSLGFNFTLPTHDLWLGTYNSTSEFHRAGYIDELRIYNEALSAADIAGIYKYIEEPSSAILAEIDEAVYFASTVSDGSITAYYADTAPGSASEGDLWFDTDDSNTIYSYQSTVWTLDPTNKVALALSNMDTIEFITDGEIVVYFQAAQPGTGSVGDVWIDIDDGNKSYVYGGSDLGWILVTSSDGLTALAALADATASLATLDEMASDGILTPVEKPPIILDVANLNNESSGIITEANRYSLSTTAYSTALTNLNNYLDTLTSDVDWDDTTGNTTVVRATFNSYFQAIYLARQNLLNAISEAAESAIDTAQTTADNAATAASDAQTDATSALTELNYISDDGYLSTAEKPAVIQQVANITNEDDGIIAEAAKYATVDPSTYTAAISALTSYLAGLNTPVLWNNLTNYTTIPDRDIFNSTFEAVYTARQDLLNSISEVVYYLTQGNSNLSDLKLYLPFNGAVDDSSGANNDPIMSGFDPAARYFFDGNLTDEIGSNDATIQAGTPSYTEGASNYAVTLDSSTEIRVPITFTDLFAFSFRIIDLTDDWADRFDIVNGSIADTVNGNFSIYRYSTTILRVAWNIGGVEYPVDIPKADFLSSSMITVLLADSNNEGKVSVYLNGILYDYVAVPFTQTGTNTYLNFNNSTTNPFTSLTIDDLVIWDYYPTDSEILSLYSNIQKDFYWVEGVSGKSLNFNGSRSYLDLDGIDVFNETNFSICLWAKLANPQKVDYAKIIDVYNSTTGDRLYIQTGTTAQERITIRVLPGSGTTGEYYTTVDALEDLRNIVLTVEDGLYVKLYINANEVISYTVDAAWGGAGDILCKIGRNYGSNSQWLYGWLDEYRIYSKTLDIEEIKTLYYNITLPADTTLKFITDIAQNTEDITLKAEAREIVEEGTVQAISGANITLDPACTDDVIEGDEILVYDSDGEFREVLEVSGYNISTNVATMIDSWGISYQEGDTYQVSRRVSGAKIKIAAGDGGYILLDAAKVIVPGTLEAGIVSTDFLQTLFANIDTLIAGYSGIGSGTINDPVDGDIALTIEEARMFISTYTNGEWNDNGDISFGLFYNNALINMFVGRGLIHPNVDLEEVVVDTPRSNENSRIFDFESDLLDSEGTSSTTETNLVTTTTWKQFGTSSLAAVSSYQGVLGNTHSIVLDDRFGQVFYYIMPEISGDIVIAEYSYDYTNYEANIAIYYDYSAEEIVLSYEKYIYGTLKESASISCSKELSTVNSGFLIGWIINLDAGALELAVDDVITSSSSGSFNYLNEYFLADKGTALITHDELGSSFSASPDKVDYREITYGATGKYFAVNFVDSQETVIGKVDSTTGEITYHTITNKHITYAETRIENVRTLVIDTELGPYAVIYGLWDTGEVTRFHTPILDDLDIALDYENSTWGGTSFCWGVDTLTVPKFTFMEFKPNGGNYSKSQFCGIALGSDYNIYITTTQLSWKSNTNSQDSSYGIPTGISTTSTAFDVLALDTETVLMAYDVYSTTHTFKYQILTNNVYVDWSPIYNTEYTDPDISASSATIYPDKLTLCKIDSSTVFVISPIGKAKILSISGTVITQGSSITLTASDYYSIKVYNSGANFIILGSGNNTIATQGTISGTTLTVTGTYDYSDTTIGMTKFLGDTDTFLALEIDSNNLKHNYGQIDTNDGSSGIKYTDNIYHIIETDTISNVDVQTLTDNKIVISYYNSTDSLGYAVIAERDTYGFLSYGTELAITTSGYIPLIKVIDSTHFAVISANTVCVCYLSDLDFTVGSDTAFNSYVTEYVPDYIDIGIISSTKFLLAYSDPNDTYDCQCKVITHNGSAITSVGTAYDFYTTDTALNPKLCMISSTRFGVGFYSSGSSTIYMDVGAIDGSDVITYAGSYTVDTVTGFSGQISLLNYSDTEFVIVYPKSTSSTYCRYVVENSGYSAGTATSIDASYAPYAGYDSLFILENGFLFFNSNEDLYLVGKSDSNVFSIESFAELTYMPQVINSSDIAYGYTTDGLLKNEPILWTPITTATDAIFNVYVYSEYGGTETTYLDDYLYFYNNPEYYVNFFINHYVLNLKWSTEYTSKDIVLIPDSGGNVVINNGGLIINGYTSDEWHEIETVNDWTGTLYYRKNSVGTVFLIFQSVASGSAATITTLPEGYRPDYTQVFQFEYSGTERTITINTDGTVVASYTVIVITTSISFSVADEMSALSGPKGETGEAGASINWRGSLSTAPIEPVYYDAYRNTADGISYIYTGSSWEVLSQDGIQGEQGDQGTPGIGAAWEAGIYSLGDVVFNDGFVWECITTTTTEEPIDTPTDWERIDIQKDVDLDGNVSISWNATDGSIDFIIN